MLPAFFTLHCIADATFAPHTDHRAIFLDINLKDIYQRTSSTPQYQPRLLKSGNQKNVAKFLLGVQTEITSSKLSQQLHTLTLKDSVSTDEISSFDSKLTDIFRKHERNLSSPFALSSPWTPLLAYQHNKLIIVNQLVALLKRRSPTEADRRKLDSKSSKISRGKWKIPWQYSLTDLLSYMKCVRSS